VSIAADEAQDAADLVKAASPDRDKR